MLPHVETCYGKTKFQMTECPAYDSVILNPTTRGHQSKEFQCGALHSERVEVFNLLPLGANARRRAGQWSWCCRMSPRKLHLNAWTHQGHLKTHMEHVEGLLHVQLFLSWTGLAVSYRSSKILKPLKKRLTRITLGNQTVSSYQEEWRGQWRRWGSRASVQPRWCKPWPSRNATNSSLGGPRPPRRSLLTRSDELQRERQKCSAHCLDIFKFCKQF